MSCVELRRIRWASGCTVSGDVRCWPRASLWPDAAKAKGSQAPAASTTGKLDYIIVLYLENHSFDNLYGGFPGAEGIAQAGDATRQLDESNQPYDFLPRNLDCRVEAVAPIRDECLKKRLKAQSWQLEPDGSYLPPSPDGWRRTVQQRLLRPLPWPISPWG